MTVSHLTSHFFNIAHETCYQEDFHDVAEIVQNDPALPALEPI
jgi:hypothetical protein